METIEVKINTNVKSTTNEMSLFRKEIQALRGQLLTLEEGTEEYNNTLSELANKQFQLREMNENVRYTVTDLGEQLATVTRITSGVVAGFSAVQGATQLFGADSENLQKTMVKLQAAMALVQGLQGLEGLGKDLGRAAIQFKGLIPNINGFIKGLSGVKAAIAGTGIGVLVILLGELIVHWDDVVDAIKSFVNETPSVEKSIDNLVAAQNRLTSSIKNSNTELERENEILKAQGASEAEILKRNLEAAQRNYNEQIKLRRDLKKQIDAIEYSEENIIGYKVDKERLQELRDSYAEADKLATEYREAIKDINHDIQLNEIETANKRKEENKRLNDKRIADAKKAAEDAKRIKEQEEADIAEINEHIRISKLSEEQAELDALTTKYNKDKALFESHQIDLTALNEYYDKLRKDIEKKYDDEATDALKRKLDEQLSLIDEQIDKLRNRVGGELFGIDFNYDISQMQDESSFFGKSPKKEFEEFKLYEDNRLAALKSGIEEENKLLQNKMEQELAMTNLTEEQKKQIREQYNAQILANNKVLEQETIASQTRIVKAQADAAKKQIQGATNVGLALMNSASQIIGQLQEGIDTTTKEGFERNKKLQIANATIQMLAGITSALSGAFTSKSGVWDWILAGIQAATIATTGAIQIANIKKQTFEGGSETPSTPNVAAMALPTQVYGTQLSDMNEINLQQTSTNTRVYVVESDIADTQHAVKTQVEESTF